MLVKTGKMDGKCVYRLYMKCFQYVLIDRFAVRGDTDKGIRFTETFKFGSGF
jgi:hypothetical protein